MRKGGGKEEGRQGRGEGGREKGRKRDTQSNRNGRKSMLKLWKDFYMYSLYSLVHVMVTGLTTPTHLLQVKVEVIQLSSKAVLGLIKSRVLGISGSQCLLRFLQPVLQLAPEKGEENGGTVETSFSGPWLLVLV